ncbi:MAG: membrane protein insertion efficiency factor YidD [Patescibacteria group bacterium]
MKNRISFINELAKQIVLGLIKTYQKTLSPDHGAFSFLHPWGYCRFQPTCSEYGYQAIEKYGIIKGGFKALWRIMRCHPWSKGGYDPVD